MNCDDTRTFPAMSHSSDTPPHVSATGGDQGVISLLHRVGPSLPHHPRTGQAETHNPKEIIMKRIVLATALIAASAFGAFAQTSPVMLSSAIESQIMTMVPGADLSNLSTSQYARLVTLFSTSENLRTGNDPVGQVKVILNAQ
jgi:hypothetical protein